MNGKIITIQYLRAFLALGVFFNHAWSSDMRHTLPMFSFNWHGTYMVEIFFMISGLVMSYTCLKDTPTNFLKKRMARIYPTYWQCYFLSMLICIILTDIFSFNLGINGGLFLHLSLLPFEYENAWNMFLPPAWSLFYEMFFYIIIATSLHFKNSKNGIYLFLILTILFPKLFLFINLDVGLFFDFIIGFLLMELIKKFNALDFSLMALAIIFKSGHDVDMAGLILNASLIIFILIKLENKGFFYKNNFLLKLGDASYSLYLLHMPLLNLLIFLNYNIEAFLFDYEYFKIIVSSIVIGVGMALIIAASIYNYEYFEKKVSQKLKKYYII